MNNLSEEEHALIDQWTDEVIESNKSYKWIWLRYAIERFFVYLAYVAAVLVVVSVIAYVVVLLLGL